MLPAPTPDEERIHSLDALRGVALLGIVWANVRQLLQPWDIGNLPLALGGSERLAWLDWQAFMALIDFKFITLFSLLFGIGFALQGERLIARGGHFSAIYLRRVAILGAFGLVHGLLLYPAEVLLPYAIAGALLLALQRLSPATMIRVGLVLLGITLLWAYQLGATGRPHLVITVSAAIALVGAVALSRKSWTLALCAWTSVVVAGGYALTVAFDVSTMGAGAAQEYQEAQQQLAAMIAGPSSAWPDEFRVRQEGGFGALLGLHAEQYALVLLYFGIALLWRTLGLFLIGAGLFRSGVLARATNQTWRRVALVGIAVGLPLSVLATWLQTREMLGRFDLRWPEFLHALSALPLAAGIAGAVFALHRSGTLRWLWKRIEAAGRMALTNYVGHSLVLSAVAEGWGLHLYGKLNGPQMTTLAIVVFATLAALSHLWLRRYRMGPLEWVWRCGTYGTWLPNRLVSRGDRADAPAGTAAPSEKRVPR
jgi:uncharacterized protein